MEKKGWPPIAAFIIFFLAFFSALAIFLSFTVPPSILEILDRYLYIRSEAEEETGVLYKNRSLQAMQSGMTDTVPWEDDDRFLEARKECGAPVLMAAFRTVLIDPLPGEEANVHLAAKRLSGKVVMPGEAFSQNLALGPYAKANGYRLGPSYSGDRVCNTYGGGVCKIASTLYNVAVLCDLPILERHCHSKPVPYVPYGQDATVAYGMFDFRFRNTNGFPILIWAEGVENKLYIAFYGAKAPPEVTWHHKLLRRFKAGRIYINNPELEKGMEKLVAEGMDGAIVQSWVTVLKSDGTETARQMGKSYYDPLTYVYEKNLYGPPSATASRRSEAAR
jgi:vancomycin resistance protein VanW